MGKDKSHPGVPKKRQPEGLEGLVVRRGKVVHNRFGEFEVKFSKHVGNYTFRKSGSKAFNIPREGEVVYAGFLGRKSTIYFPEKVCDEKGQILYQRN